MTVWERLPMFPLGNPLVPTMLLPLHIFEPRYTAMLDKVLAGDRMFGVVMIERGSEVGGGELRTEVGTLAEVLQAEEQAPGQWAVLAVGRERIRVDTWFADDPHPVASAHAWPDESGPDEREPDEREPDESEPSKSVAGAWDELVASHRELMDAIAAARPEFEPPEIEFRDDPSEATYQLIVASPLGPLDRHRLLSTPSLEQRTTLLQAEFDELITVVRAELD